MIAIADAVNVRYEQVFILENRKKISIMQEDK